MDKQLLQRNDSFESLQLQGQAGSHANAAIPEGKSTPSFSNPSKKYKTLLLVVGVLAGVAVCAVVATAGIAGTQAQGGDGTLSSGVPQFERRVQNDDPLIDMATKEQLLRKAADLRAKRFSSRVRGPQITTCYSTKTSRNYPAARVSGTGSQWQKVPRENNDPSQTAGDWITKWVCANDSNAYVDGGMVFDQKDKKLYVPVCGYYYISSQMYFQYTHNNSINTTEAQFVSYEVKVNRSCTDDNEDNHVLLRSYATVVTTPTSRLGKATLYIGGVVKICKGGSIRAHVPAFPFNSCCPIGHFQTTYLSSFLIHKTGCERTVSLDFPPPVSNEDIENEDESD